MTRQNRFLRNHDFVESLPFYYFKDMKLEEYFLSNRLNSKSTLIRTEVMTIFFRDLKIIRDFNYKGYEYFYDLKN